ncbi:MAG: Cys-tRNA(Pro) deacylase [Deltaproteobacteria bacterium]|nr:MAG: Cys-tRNA(Pro) deacylase [Deltaproteobacteria bacterium]
MEKERFSATQAIRALREHGADFTLQHYKFEEKGGTEVAARELGVDESLVVKTLVMEDEAGSPFLVLMHGGRQVTTKALARVLGVKSVRPCEPHVAHKHTGYFVGGISPFGTRKPLRVFVEQSILGLSKIYINAGKKGLLAEMSPGDLKKILNPTPVNVAI